jgi:hypothetical protein
VETTPVKLFSIKWDPVTTYADGTPIAEVTVSYTAYWTMDPAMSETSLRVLGGSTPATSLDFDPVAEGMEKNKRVYFKTKATITSGESSPLSPEVSWMADNTGPTPPANVKIIKKY